MTSCQGCFRSQEATFTERQKNTRCVHDPVRCSVYATQRNQIVCDPWLSLTGGLAAFVCVHLVGSVPSPDPAENVEVKRRKSWSKKMLSKIDHNNVVDVKQGIYIYFFLTAAGADLRQIKWQQMWLADAIFILFFCTSAEHAVHALCVSMFTGESFYGSVHNIPKEITQSACSWCWKTSSSGGNQAQMIWWEKATDHRAGLACVPSSPHANFRWKLGCDLSVFFSPGFWPVSFPCTCDEVFCQC